MQRPTAACSFCRSGARAPKNNESSLQPSRDFKAIHHSGDLFQLLRDQHRSAAVLWLRGPQKRERKNFCEEGRLISHPCSPVDKAAAQPDTRSTSGSSCNATEFPRFALLSPGELFLKGNTCTITHEYGICWDLLTPETEDGGPRLGRPMDT